MGTRTGQELLKLPPPVRAYPSLRRRMASLARTSYLRYRLVSVAGTSLGLIRSPPSYASVA
jgi:hypothetical protein